MTEKLTHSPRKSVEAPGEYGYYDELHIFYVQMPPEPDVKRFYGLLFNLLGGEVRSSMSIAELETMVMSLLRVLQVKMLIIDETHNIFSGRREKQREFLNFLRFLGNELQIPIVCAGTKEAYLAIRTDDQLENRFEPFVLPLWEANETNYSLLASFVQLMPLRKTSSLTEPVCADYILQRTEGILGEISTLIMRAAIKAIYLGYERMDFYLLQQTNYQSPSERRQCIERMLI